MIIGVLGCMAQKDQQVIFRRAPHVDLVLGPGQLGQLRVLLDQIAAGGGPRMEVSLDRAAGDRAAVQRSFVPFVPRSARRRAAPMPHQAMVRIMFGCDMFCTYCVVPRVRGPEQSRPAAEILDEVRRLADDGCLEVTLLGQTVNSYEDCTGPSTVELADLLYQLHEVGGIRRMKFVTNHPKFMTDRLLQAVRDLPKVSPYLHVPAQSGSNAVLQRMKRGYTVELYRDMLERIRRFDSPSGRDERFHRRILRRDRGGFSADGRACAGCPIQKQLHLQVQRSARHEGGRTCTKTTFRRRSSGGGTTICWRFKTPSASKTTNCFSAARSRSWSKGRAKWRRKRDCPDFAPTKTGMSLCRNQEDCRHGRHATCRPYDLRPDRRFRRPARVDRPLAAGPDREGRCIYDVRQSGVETNLTTK